jgi:SAM-dependent methyltransferase
MPSDTSLRELAIHGTNDWVMDSLRRTLPKGSLRILEVGAGEGALCARLLKDGHRVVACELRPELFKLEGVECHKVDATLALPFADQEFDVVLAVEVVEHMDGQGSFFEEVQRVLKPGGCFVFTTPNILSLKSRVIFLLSGYFYSFGPLAAEKNPDRSHPHISPFTLDRYRFLLAQYGFTIESVSTDKFQTSSRFWAWLIPLIRVCSRSWYAAKDNVRLQNSRVVLFGRTLFVVARRQQTQRQQTRRRNALGSVV